MPVQGCGASAQLTPGIASKVFQRDVPEIDFRETHWVAIDSRPGFVIDRIDENAHPLVSCAMRIDGLASFPSTLRFDALLTRFDGTVRIDFLYTQIRMTITIFVFAKRS